MTKYVLTGGASAKNLPLDNIAAWRDSGILDAWGMGDTADLGVTSSYGAVGWVYRCVNVRAAALSTMPWSIFRGDDEVADSESAELDALPWLEDLPALLYLAEASLCIQSESYWFKDRNRGRRTTSLRTLASNTMAPIWSTEGIVAYERRANNRTLTIEPDRIVYLRLPNPLHETQPGTAPVAAALGDAEVIFNLTQFAALYFKRGAVKPTIIGMHGTTQSEHERVQAWWGRLIAGIRNAWTGTTVHMTADGGLHVQTIGDGIDSLNNEALSAEKRESISTTLGIPHSLVMSNAANFATAQADRMNFYDTTIIPQARMIQSAVNRQLFDDYGLRFQFRPESMSLYQQDENDRASAFEAYARSGLPKSLVAEMLGLALPPGWEYADLDDEPQTITVLQPEPARIEATPEPVQDDAEKRADADRFRKWYGKRRNADPAKFASDHLTDNDKAAIIAEVEDGAAENAPFPVAEWADYP